MFFVHKKKKIILFIGIEGLDKSLFLYYNINMINEIETICIHKHNVTNIICDFKMLKERYNNYKNKNGKINIVIISNEDVINKVLNLSVKVVKSKNIINFLEEYIKYIDIFNVFARRTKNDLELDELNFLKDVEIDKFSEASNKNNYNSIYDYEIDVVNNWKYNGF